MVVCAGGDDGGQGGGGQEGSAGGARPASGAPAARALRPCGHGERTRRRAEPGTRNADDRGSPARCAPGEARALEAKGKDAELTKGEGRFLVVVEDNGPGIVKAQVPKIFGKLLYGSKFHRLKQARGQQGIGISAAAMYGQLTTGKPIRVTSRVGKRKDAHVFDIQLDTRKNEPVVTHDETLPDWHQEHGTRVELEIVANWQQGQRFVNRYVEHTALANPHAII